MTEWIGHQLGNYRLLRLLGQGGFADVYLGEHQYLNTKAAIKVLQARLTNEDSTNFQNEARTIASLVHPNIVRVLEFGLQGRLVAQWTVDRVGQPGWHGAGLAGGVKLEIRRL